MPKTKPPVLAADDLAAQADKLYTLREERLAKQREVDSLQKEESALRASIIEKLAESKNATGIAGQLVRVTLREKAVPQVTDWDALQKHVKKTGDFDLLQRRVSDTAIRERWEAGRTVPGVATITIHDLSVNKL